jgi:hypothetical protein
MGREDAGDGEGFQSVCVGGEGGGWSQTDAGFRLRAFHEGVYRDCLAACLTDRPPFHARIGGLDWLPPAFARLAAAAGPPEAAGGGGDGAAGGGASAGQTKEGGGGAGGGGRAGLAPVAEAAAEAGGRPQSGQVGVRRLAEGVVCIVGWSGMPAPRCKREMRGLSRRPAAGGLFLLAAGDAGRVREASRGDRVRDAMRAPASRRRCDTRGGHHLCAARPRPS